MEEWAAAREEDAVRVALQAAAERSEAVAEQMMRTLSLSLRNEVRACGVRVRGRLGSYESCSGSPVGRRVSVKRLAFMTRSSVWHS